MIFFFLPQRTSVNRGSLFPTQRIILFRLLCLLFFLGKLVLFQKALSHLLVEKSSSYPISFFFSSFGEIKENRLSRKVWEKLSLMEKKWRWGEPRPNGRGNGNNPVPFGSPMEAAGCGVPDLASKDSDWEVVVPVAGPWRSQFH